MEEPARLACHTLAQLQDDLEWKFVTPKFKVTAKKWNLELQKLTQSQGAMSRASTSPSSV